MINMETKNLIVSLGTKPDSIRIADITISLPHQLGIVQIVDWPLLTRVVNTFPSTTTSYVKFRGYAVLVAMTLKLFAVLRLIGEGSTFVARDSDGVKIFDLPSGSPEMIIHQRCINSTPVYLNEAKFVCNRLRNGRCAMMWDPRAQKPLYSLPIAWSDDIAWIPTKIPRLRPPNAITTGWQIVRGRLGRNLKKTEVKVMELAVLCKPDNFISPLLYFRAMSTCELYST